MLSVIPMAFVPEFRIDNDVLNLVSDIAVLADRASDGMMPLDARLKRANRIRSVRSSLVIEGSRFTLDDVMDIIDGNAVDGDANEIKEVKNAYKSYDLIGHLNPYSVDDMLKAHNTMMKGLVKHPGRFRDCEVGVYKGDIAVHIAPAPGEVGNLVEELMDWASDPDINPLIKACIFHCRFEYIHPFIDGNGRMGRLWQALILSGWNDIFAYIPVESWILMDRQEYYESLTEADDGDLTSFLKTMLRMIRNALKEQNDETRFTSGTTKRESEVLNIISRNPNATVSNIASSLGVSDRTAKRHISALTAKGWIKRTGSKGTWNWEIL